MSEREERELSALVFTLFFFLVLFSALDKYISWLGRNRVGWIFCQVFGFMPL